MYYHFRYGYWNPVDKTPAQIASAKKAATKAAKLAAAAALLASGGGGPAVAGMTAAAQALTAVAPGVDKLRAVNLAKLVFQQFHIEMESELDKI
jgi:hypothetical protein